MIGDRDAAYDISQESFISAYDGLRNFRSDSKFSTWLYSITVNKCRDYLRCRKPDVPLDEVTEILRRTHKLKESEEDDFRVMSQSSNCPSISRSMINSCAIPSIRPGVGSCKARTAPRLRRLGAAYSI